MVDDRGVEFEMPLMARSKGQDHFGTGGRGLFGGGPGQGG